MDLIREKVDKKYFKKLPDFRPGDTIKVHVRIVEGEKSRIQIFEGTVIKMRGGDVGSYTVRKTSDGVGVERIFPYSCPSVDTVEVAQKGRARRAKLYYLRKLIGKAARVSNEKEAAVVTPKA